MSKQHDSGITLPTIVESEQKCFGFHYLQKQLTFVVTISKSKAAVPIGMKVSNTNGVCSKGNPEVKKVRVWVKKRECNANEMQNGIKIAKDGISKYYYNELSTNNTNESRNNNDMRSYYDKSNDEMKGTVISDLSAFETEDCKCEGDIVECEEINWMELTDEYDSLCLSNDEDDEIQNNNINIKGNSNNVNFNINNTNERFMSFCKNIDHKLNVRIKGENFL